MKIGNRDIRDFGIPYIIAEIGANHNGDMNLAKQMIKSAKNCGCDAVKFQSWTPESLISKEEYLRNQKYNDSLKKHFGSLREMVERYYLRKDQHVELKNYCEEINIKFSSTPFSIEEVDFLEELGVPFFKVASMDINNHLLLRHIARKKKPVIISTGMSDLSEINNAIHTVEREGNTEIILLHCVSVYPPAFEDIHLNNIVMLRNTFGYPVGFSDHTIGTAIPISAVSLGSCMIEKHFTLDKNMDGWDHEISANPEEMEILVRESCNVVKALGGFRRIVTQAEEEKKLKFRRSLVSRFDLTKGHIMAMEDITCKRPGTGIASDKIDYVIGRKLKRDIGADELILWDDFV